MRIVKRYSNRKLYDTHAKRYVRLQDVAALVRGGERIRVVDNVTSEDLTTATLSRILMEKERRRKRPMSPAFFASLLRFGPGPGKAGDLRRTVASLEARVASLERRLTPEGR